MDPLKLTISPYRVYDRIQAIPDDTIYALYPSLYQVLYKDITDRLTHVSLLPSFYPAHAQGLISSCCDGCVSLFCAARLLKQAQGKGLSSSAILGLGAPGFLACWRGWSRSWREPK